MIEFKDIHKAFGGNEVLKGISCTIPTGSVTVILGPSFIALYFLCRI